MSDPQTPATQATQQTQPQTQQPTATPPATPPTPQSDDRFKALLERDRHIRTAAEALKQKEQVIREAEEIKARAKADPMAFLQEQGVSYDEWTKKYLQGQKGDPTAPIKTEIQKIQEQLEQERQAREQAFARQQEEMDRSYVRQYVDSGDYPALKAAKAQNLVYDHIQNHYRRTGQFISEDQAASEVEAYLVNLVTNLAAVEKVQKAFRPAPPQPETQAQPGRGQPGITLGNQHTATVPSRQDTNQKLLSFEESLAAAARMLRFSETQ